MNTKNAFIWFGRPNGLHRRTQDWVFYQYFTLLQSSLFNITALCSKPFCQLDDTSINVIYALICVQLFILIFIPISYQRTKILALHDNYAYSAITKHLSIYSA